MLKEHLKLAEMPECNKKKPPLPRCKQIPVTGLFLRVVNLSLRKCCPHNWSCTPHIIHNYLQVSALLLKTECFAFRFSIHTVCTFFPDVFFDWPLNRNASERQYFLFYFMVMYSAVRNKNHA